MLKKAMTTTLFFTVAVVLIIGFVVPAQPSGTVAAAGLSVGVPPTINPAGTVGTRGSIHDDPAGGIYVSPDGNDGTATGSVSKPYKSINAALAAAPAGSTVILRGGTYIQPAATEVRVVRPNITIKSAKGEWAHINLPFPADIKDQYDGNSAVRFDPDATGCKLQSVEVSGGFYALCFNTTWDWGPSYPTRYGVSGVTVEDCILHDSRYEVVKVKPNCNNITFRYNEIYNPARAEIDTQAWLDGEAHAEAIDNVNGNNMVVQNNYLHDVNVGLYAKGGARDVLIENNRIEDALGAGIVIGFDTSPAYFDLTVNPQYYESIRSIVRNNLIINTGWEGIGFYAAKDAQVYNNTVINARRVGTVRYHSPVYFGIATQDWDNPAGCPPSINPQFHHNVVCQPSGSDRLMIDIRFIQNFRFDSYPLYPLTDLSSLTGMPVMHDNCYFIPGTTTTFSDHRISSPLSEGSLSAWQSHIGGDSGSVGVDPVLNADYLVTNPLYTGRGIQSALIPTTIPGGGTPGKPPHTTSQFAYSLSKKPYTGKAQAISVSPKAGAGKVTAIYYSGAFATPWAKSTTPPKSIGSYAVTIDVAESADRSAVKELFLGTFDIVPSATSVKTLTSGKGLLKVNWKKVSKTQKITGYQLRYKMAGSTTWKVKTVPSSKAQVTIKELKSGRKYQVSMRCYKTLAGNKYLGNWSKAKTSKKIK